MPWKNQISRREPWATRVLSMLRTGVTPDPAADENKAAGPGRVEVELAGGRLDIEDVAFLDLLVEKSGSEAGRGALFAAAECA